MRARLHSRRWQLMATTCHGRVEVLALTVLVGLLAAPVRGDTNSLRLTLRWEAGRARLHWSSQPGERFQIEHRTDLFAPDAWQILSTNWPAVGTNTGFIHASALNASASFYRVLRFATPAFTFNWTGTNFTYTDAQRTFSGIWVMSRLSRARPVRPTSSRRRGRGLKWPPRLLRR